MASSSGTTSSSSLIHQSGSEGDLQILMDQRKRKRMISNRESARRSRMRKQKHLDDLVNQVAQLKKENQQILSSFNLTTEQLLRLESDNSVLRAQASELTNRLQSLNEIIEFLNANNNNNNNNGVFGGGAASSSFENINNNGFFFNNNNNNINNMGGGYLSHPIMASASADFWDF